MQRIALAFFITIMTAASSFSEVVKPSEVVFQDGAVMESLTAQLGDPASGRKIFINRKQGNCLACHMNSEMLDQSFHGEVGPVLDGVADRWEKAELRGMLVNSKMMFEGTIMPAFYRDSGYSRNLKKFVGKTILSAQQVEDVLSYLLTLKEN